MSWIVKDLWDSLDKRRREFESFWMDRTLRGFEVINWIASDVGQRWGVDIEINFPPGQERPEAELIGHNNVSILVNKSKRSFEIVSSDEVKREIQTLNPTTLELARFGHEGFRANLPTGRIDCLASGVHLWCNITPEVLAFLDWIFVNEYGLERPNP